MGWYRSVCHYDECDQQFVGVSKEEYVDHLEQQHGPLAARVADEMIIDTCPRCENRLDRGECHRCGWTTENVQLGPVDD